MRVPGTAISCIAFSVKIISCSWAWPFFSFFCGSHHSVVWGFPECCKFYWLNTRWLNTYCLDLSFGNLKIVSQQPVSEFALATSLSAMMAAASTSHSLAMEWNSAPMALMKLSARTVSATWDNTACESHCRLYHQRETISPFMVSPLVKEQLATSMEPLTAYNNVRKI